jgi:FAD/FMN-containing dehydrogenase/Fe-S oxidoreductase
MNNPYIKLKDSLKGDLYTDKKSRLLYATDASAYREIPVAVARPKDKNDLISLITFANTENVSLIPRTAGTSLAGQVVGGGIVVDVSRYMTNILEINSEEQWVRVQPGVILDELNHFLKDYGLFFGPETSTSNRCMLGGMVGNNACGSHSILYGSTRDHTIAVKGILSDGSEAEFGPLTKEEFKEKTKGKSLENVIYQNIWNILSDSGNQEEIEKEYPDKFIYRRNTGYALDLLLDSSVFKNKDGKFNFSKLICGSEGTLMFITEIKLNLVPLPPENKAVIAAHFESREEAFQANLVALSHKPGAVEMMDEIILELTKGNPEQLKNRSFIKGNPGAILIIEFERETIQEIEQIHRELTRDLQKEGLGYYFPLLFEPETTKVWNLRKAGLGVLSNMKGDARPVSIVEDTAVNVEILPDYMKDFQKILDQFNVECVYHAHIGSGELHLRPVLNLKDPEDVRKFREIGLAIAHLVKKYNGSLSGEHGDGRVRGEFIPIILGDKNYQLLKQVKDTWDPKHIFNPGKIVEVPDMTTNLRYEPGKSDREIKTEFDFSDVGGILRATEKCNGSGDCRKTEITGGTMCPSYMATRDENDVTRARANILREFLTNSTKRNPFDHKEIYEVMDLCLSCKACKTECPSSVDVAKLKAEFLQHYYDAHGIPLRTKLIAFLPRINNLGAMWPWFFNIFLKYKPILRIVNRVLGFAPGRSMPLIQKQTLSKWMKGYIKNIQNNRHKNGKVYLFNDEFTNFNDTDIGIKTIQLLTRLGYEVAIPDHSESGRTFLSKGLLRKARQIANQNIDRLKELISEKTPLVGVEPSTILAFRDEYPDLAYDRNKEVATILAKHAFTIEEFLKQQMDAGKITTGQFTQKEQKVLLHGHCQQKAVASTDPSLAVLSFPVNYTVKEIPSGCCGMAGSFGYEKEHYDVSMKVGELVLFPAVRNAAPETIIAAPGTSCRHQIKDGTNVNAKHPVDILYDALA